jgi:hypothetical protein
VRTQFRAVAFRNQTSNFTAFDVSGRPHGPKYSSRCRPPAPDAAETGVVRYTQSTGNTDGKSVLFVTKPWAGSDPEARGNKKLSVCFPVTVRKCIAMLLSVLVLFISIVTSLAASSATSKQVVKKSDPNDNRGNTPFFLQDPYDETCLGPKDFTVCDENALWILTKRTGKKTYSLVSLLNPQTTGGLCLETKPMLFGLMRTDRVSIGPCSSGRAKSWEFEFIDQTHVKLSTKGHAWSGERRPTRTPSQYNLAAKTSISRWSITPPLCTRMGFTSRLPMGSASMAPSFDRVKAAGPTSCCGGWAFATCGVKRSGTYSTFTSRTGRTASWPAAPTSRRVRARTAAPRRGRWVMANLPSGRAARRALPGALTTPPP